MKDTKQKIIGTAAIIILLILGIYVMEHRGVYQVKLATPTEPTATATPMPTPPYSLNINKENGIVTYKDNISTVTFSYPTAWHTSKNDNSISITSPDSKVIGAGNFKSGGTLHVIWYKKDMFLKKDTSINVRDILLHNYEFARDNATDTSVSIWNEQDTINGNPAIRYKIKQWGTGNGNVALIYNNGNLFRFECLFADKDQVSINQTCEKIINSFRNEITYNTFNFEQEHMAFEIPSSWSIEKIPNLVFYSLNKEETTSLKGSSIALFVTPSTFSKPLEEYYSNNNTDYIITTKENMYIQGYRSLKYTVKLPGRADGTGLGALILKDHKLYRFEVTYDVPEKMETMIVFNHLLTSIKFD